MITIISSVIVDVSPQVDGRAYIHEQHLDSAGIIHELFYLSEPTDDREMILKQHADNLLSQLNIVSE